MAGSKLGPDVKAVFALIVLLTVFATLVDSGMLAWLIAPIVLAGTVYCVSQAPLRYTLMVLMYFSFVLENPNEMPAGGMWKSSLFTMGAMLLTHMNNHTGVSFLSFSGLDLVIVIAIVVALSRRSSRSPIDREGRMPSPKELTKLAWLSLAGTGYVWVWGLVRGGEAGISVWQVEKVVYIPVLLLLFQAALRNTKDFVAVGKVIILAALTRSLLAHYVMHFAEIPDEGVPPHATSHHDSVLFACAVVILVSMLIHRARRDAWLIMLVTLPILMMGMIANNRRMVWVQIILVFVTLYFVMPMNTVKRKIRRVALVLSPFVAAYIVVGWKSSSSVFKPVATIRSVVEPATDVSTMTRDIENYNITQTIRQAPIMGNGYGHGYIELIPLPPMPYPLERYLPHNSTLGLWMAGGFIGYTAITLLWAAGVYFGVRAYRASAKPMERAIALVSFAAVLIYMIQCYGDVGLGSLAGVYTVAPALAIAGKLAVSTGAWPMAGVNIEAKPSAAKAPEVRSVPPAPPS